VKKHNIISLIKSKTKQTYRKISINLINLIPFEISSYEKSASLYALSHKSFEEIALKFLQISEDEALKQFLICKLDTMTEKDITQSTILLLWLLEILLNQMGSLKNAGKLITDKYQLIEAEFESLLSQSKIRVILL